MARESGVGHCPETSSYAWTKITGSRHIPTTDAEHLVQGVRLCRRLTQALGRNEKIRSIWLLPNQRFIRSPDGGCTRVLRARPNSIRGIRRRYAWDRLSNWAIQEPEATLLLHHCKNQLAEIEHIFAVNASVNDSEVRRATRHRLQRLYYDAYQKAGPLLKPSRKADDIGPDDDV